ncbi:BtrH N-terminal domain-containing protein [Alkaliphilus transvaalensis]|uniref:BtrH N-terminal domain-containing protein n=1 Tax=Alkaliphilus transvaalensis TaxID=114628 RepID=UPI0004788BEA|nr:BtrH N-terminal domain-containing protein [Alkaliphilus transvaalensis]
MIIENFNPFYGKHCETTTVGNLLRNCGLELSEPLIFGVGEGLSFIYWDSKQMEFPFLGGRCKPDILTENIVKNLNLSIELYQTSSRSKAWDNVKSKIDNNIPVGLKLDCYHLEYFTQKIHFAGHYVTIYGYDNDFAYLIDTDQQGSDVKTSLVSLADARSEKGPMSSKNRSFTIIRRNDPPNLKDVIISAINHNAYEYLNPPIQNISFKGIRKTAKVIGNWFERPGMTPELIIQAGTLMERAGTGGGLFRNMYRDFLGECNDLYPDLNLKNPNEKFCTIADMWTEVSNLICKAGENSNEQYLKEASLILLEIASLEEEAMKILFEKTSIFHK